MASFFHAPAFRTALRRPITAPVARDVALPRTTPSASVNMAQLWQESLQAFSANGGMVLLCAFFGLLSPFLVGCWIATQAVLQDMAWVGPVPTLQEKLPPATLAVLGIVGWLMASFTRGIITGLALQHRANQAVRDALAHLPALLVSSLVYSALIAGCLLVLSPIAKHDSILSRDSAAPIWLGWMNAMDNTRHQIAGEALPLLLPEAGSPFAELVPYLHNVLFRPMQPTGYERWLAEQWGNATSLANDAPRRLSTAGSTSTLAVGIASFALLIITEMLLRFRIVLAIEPSEVMLASTVKSGGYHPRRFTALSPLTESARFGLKHFGVITLHVWLLRLAGAALMLLFAALPMAASTQVMMPALITWTGKTPLLPALHFVQSSISACIMALVLAFSTIYDAQLFTALRRTTD